MLPSTLRRLQNISKTFNNNSNNNHHRHPIGKSTTTFLQRNFSSSTKEDEGMQDEYGDMDDSGETFTTTNFKLESGKVLDEVNVRYKTWGTLNENADNAIVVCHALTGNAALDSWWGGLLGPDLPFDTNKYFVVCANVLGSCYGTTGPTSINPTTNNEYASDFPHVTVRDSVKAHQELLKDGLNVKSIKSVIGGSMGGMQVLEWMFYGSDFVRTGIPIACGGHHHAWQIAISESQRQAIYADPKYLSGKYSKNDPPHGGLAVARQIAMISYRTHAAYEKKFGRERADGNESSDKLDALFSVEGYLHHQGQKFLTRFDPNSYITCTQLMDSHDVGRGRGGEEMALNQLNQPSLIIGIDSDALYPIIEQENLAKNIKNSELHILRSDEGHDGFLLEQVQIAALIEQFLNKYD